MLNGQAHHSSTVRTRVQNSFQHYRGSCCEPLLPNAVLRSFWVGRALVRTIVIGAGITGLTTGPALRRAGFGVLVRERAPGVGTAGASPGCGPPCSPMKNRGSAAPSAARRRRRSGRRRSGRGRPPVDPCTARRVPATATCSSAGRVDPWFVAPHREAVEHGPEVAQQPAEQDVVLPQHDDDRPQLRELLVQQREGSDVLSGVVLVRRGAEGRAVLRRSRGRVRPQPVVDQNHLVTERGRTPGRVPRGPHVRSLPVRSPVERRGAPRADDRTGGSRGGCPRPAEPKRQVYNSLS
ncbi:NAD(P)-binding protein [Umezawaea beigongshangensis]|uniref:NAD(P)-binding protein n=1 Tax=Umezawaea beigongshangensis TaxID=2780383 RepID=UPI0034D7B9D6